MSTRPKVSVIIANYNNEPYLRRALESVVNQTLKDIEVICVDDGSYDASRSIIDEFAQLDDRIFKIYHEKNLKLLQTRKDGVLASCGEYIMFLDSDDAYKLNACEVAYNAIVSAGTDIVQFATDVKDCTDFSGSRQSLNKYLLPLLEKIEGDLVKACWKDKKFSSTIWNKIYYGDLTRSAFKEIEDAEITMAEDVCAFFAIAYYAKNYQGISDKLYEYNFGLGVTGQAIINLSQFKLQFDEVKVSQAIEKFCQRHNVEEEYNEIVRGISLHFLDECVALWRDNIIACDRSKAFKELVAAFGLDNVICALAKNDWNPSNRLFGKLADLSQFRYVPRPEDKKLTIALYYHRIANGGTERVVSMLCNRWAELKNDDGSDKYTVVLIVDTEKLDNEYTLSDKVKRAYLPSFRTSVKDKYPVRLNAWRTIIQENDIDIVIYNLWATEASFWDILAVKSASTHPACISHYHFFCGVPYTSGGQLSKLMIDRYGIADGVTVLSECDREYVSAFNVNTRCIINPFVYIPKDTKNSIYEKNTIVWCGRLSSEKQPMDVLKMVKYLRQFVPDILLYVVGESNAKLKERMIQCIEINGLGANVRMTGFTLNPEEYYRKASAFIMTSIYECFPLTIGEALAHGVPVVTYDMPWLTYLRDGRGIVTVPQGQYTMLADEVIKLLRDPDRIRELGAQGKQMVTELANVDIMAQWNELFAAINSGTKAPSRTDSAAINYRYLTLFAAEGKKAAAAAAKIQGQREARNAPAVRPFLTGRIDVKNFGEGNEVMLSNVTPGTFTEKPAWFSKNGQGAVLESTSGQMSFVCQCVGDGTLRFDLRGRCIRDAEKKTLPYYVDFTSFTIDGKEILPKKTSVWHDAPFKYERPVKDGEIVTVTAKWQPHVPERSVLIDGPKKAKELRDQLDGVRKDADLMRQKLRHAEESEAALNSQLEKSRKSAAVLAQKIELADERGLELQKRLDLSQKERSAVERKLEQKRQAQLELTARLNDAETQLRNIRRGFSFRIGRLVTWLPRKLTGKKW